MSTDVSSIVGVCMNRMDCEFMSICDDWTVAIIAINVNSVRVDDWTIERPTITSNVKEKLTCKCVRIITSFIIIENELC